MKRFDNCKKRERNGTWKGVFVPDKKYCKNNCNIKECEFKK
jgi:hypothetical protein